MNDFPKVLHETKSVLFADDTSLSYTHSNITNLFQIVNDELLNATDWFRANKLSINATKTHYVLFHSRHMMIEDNNLKLVLGNNIIERNHFVKFIGLYLDEKLEWANHISHVEAKISKSLYIMNSVKNILPFFTMKMLYYSLIYSHLNYGVIHWGSAFKYRLGTMIKLQKRAVRVITKSKISAHTSPLFLKTYILQIIN